MSINIVEINGLTTTQLSQGYCTIIWHLPFEERKRKEWRQKNTGGKEKGEKGKGGEKSVEWKINIFQLMCNDPLTNDWHWPYPIELARILADIPNLSFHLHRMSESYRISGY